MQPEKLYHFQPFNELTLRNLKKQIIYFNSPKNFNDPYDCNYEIRFKTLSEDDQRRYIDLIEKDPRTPSKVLEDLKIRFPEKIKDILRNMGRVALKDLRDSFASPIPPWNAWKLLL